MPQEIPRNGALVYSLNSTGNQEFFAGFPVDAAVNPDYYFFKDDFGPLHGKAFNATDMYDVVKDTSAAVAIADSLNGEVTITSQATTDNDGGLIQQTLGQLARVTGKKLWFEARVKVSDIDHDMFVGLAEQAATDPEAVIAATIHRLGFEVTEANGANIRFSNGDGTAVDFSDTGYAMVAATYVMVGFHYNGSTIDVYINRNKVLSGVRPQPASATDLMGIAIFNLSGNTTSTHVLTCDYVMVCAER